MESQNWEKSLIEKVLLETVKEQKRTRRWRIFFRLIWLLIIGFIFYLFAAKFSFGGSSSTSTTGPQVALINLSGEISKDNNTYANISEGLKDALADSKTVGVIIKANSPGGSPVYSDMLYNEINALRKKYPQKPIDVVVEEMCASGCYYIASAANQIYAQPASIVGSIGVIYAGFGATGLMQKLGIDSRLLISGKNKAMGYPFIPENQDQVVMQQQMLDEIHSQFIDAVKHGRGEKLALNDPDLFSGRYWIGQDALKLGLIDGFSTVDDLANKLYKSDNIVDFTPQDDSISKAMRKFGLTIADTVKQSLSLNDGGVYR
jgi:protease IV